MVQWLNMVLALAAGTDFVMASLSCVWLCGYAREADCHRYSAHNFYGEIKRYFRWLGGAP